jgi:hypothetical protein
MLTTPDKNEGPLNLDLDLRARLRNYMPVLFKFFDVKDLTTDQWSTLESNFTEVYKQRKAKYEANNNYLQVKPNFYDIVTGKLRGDEAPTKFFDFIRKLLEELDIKLEPAEKSLIVDTLYNLLINFDNRFLNFLGELLVLNSLKANRKFVLKKVESQIVDDKNADFLFEYEGKSLHLIEVVNFHIDDHNTKLSELFERKLTAKVQKKTNGKQVYNNFSLVPVIWAPYVDLERVLGLFQQNGKICSLPNVWELVAYMAATYPDGAILYRFGTLSTLLAKPVN